MKEHPVLTVPLQTYGTEFKREGHTDYKYVCIVSYNGEMTYRAEIPKLRFSKCFADAHDAAKAVDLTLAQNGYYPVNKTLKPQIKK